MADIIDNRNEILIDHIKRALSTSEKAKFTLGYFFLSGFEAIKDELKNLKEIRLLIGNTTIIEARPRHSVLPAILKSYS